MNKKILAGLLILCLIAALTAGCSSNKLIGKWSDKNDILEFKKDGKFTAHYYWLPGTYTINGDQITISSPLLPNETYTYVVENNTLQLKKGDDVVYTFKKAK